MASLLATIWSNPYFCVDSAWYCCSCLRITSADSRISSSRCLTWLMSRITASTISSLPLASFSGVNTTSAQVRRPSLHQEHPLAGPVGRALENLTADAVLAGHRTALLVLALEELIADRRLIHDLVAGVAEHSLAGLVIENDVTVVVEDHYPVQGIRQTVHQGIGGQPQGR